MIIYVFNFGERRALITNALNSPGDTFTVLARYCNVGENGRSDSFMDLNLDLLSNLTDFIANVGFPIFISLFLLNRIETKIDHMIDALNQLVKVIAQGV